MCRLHRKRRDRDGERRVRSGALVKISRSVLLIVSGELDQVWGSLAVGGSGSTVVARRSARSATVAARSVAASPGAP